MLRRTGIRLPCPGLARIGFLATLLIAVAVGVANAAGDPAPPNVVILLADDLGWADVGYHDGEIKTPGIDRLAREGLRLERFYAAPICSPTRAALLTGRDPLKLGLAYDQLHPWYNAGLSPDAYTLADAFQAAGYQTGLVGKWHLGHTQAHQLPNAHGFEHFHGHLHTNTDYWKHEREGAHDLQQNGESISLPGEYLTHIQQREAIRFIRARDPKRPFLLYVPFTAPHSPMQAPEEAINRYAHLPAKGYRRTYAAMVDEMDRAIAAILETLDREGLAENTLVLFFSDNGGFRGFGGRNTPLRGEKGQTFEGGIRVPAVLRWPGQLPAGKSVDAQTSVMDVFPTLAAAASISLDENAIMDGHDMWPVFHAGEAPDKPPALFFASEIPIPGLIHLAVIDLPWKLVQIVHEVQTEIRIRNFLFRILEDPNEKEDLAAAHPEIVEKLAGRIHRWRSQHPMAGTRGTLVAHPGWVAPLDWAEAVVPAALLQPRWENELPFPKALLDATADRGVLVDEATRRKLEEQEKKRAESWAD
ncbi:MAG: sulfatase-like hydrolase/transferase [Myxococcota bacterium]